MSKKAFTMLEFVFVIIVIAVLASAVVSNMQKNTIGEVGIQLVEHIRYTQHLAIVDDKYDTSSNEWYKQRWQIAFPQRGDVSYMIFSDAPSVVGAYDGNPDATDDYSRVEVAKNPLDRSKYLIGVSRGSFAHSDTSRLTTRLNLTTQYGITDYSFFGGNNSTANRIYFDHLGRPYRGTGASTATHPFGSPNDYLNTSTVYIKLCKEACTVPRTTANNDNEVVIAIEPITGYAHIL